MLVVLTLVEVVVVTLVLVDDELDEVLDDVLVEVVAPTAVLDVVLLVDVDVLDDVVVVVEPRQSAVRVPAFPAAGPPTCFIQKQLSPTIR